MRPLVALVALLATTPARAEEASRADGRLPAAVIDRFLARLVPLTFALPDDQRAAVVEARWCGGGRVLAVLSASARRAFLRDGDCKEKPAAVAARGGETVTELLVAWASGQLRVSLGEVATAGDEGSRLGPALAKARAAGPLAKIATKGLPLRTAGGATQTYDLAIAFGKSDAVLLAMAPAGRAPAPRPDQPAAGADATVSATYAFANGLLTLFTRDEPFTLDVEGQVVEIRSLRLESADGGVKVKGQAQARGIAEVAHLTIAAAGPDLAITEVGAEADLEDCAGLGTVSALACRARNGARAGAAAALAAALSGRYRGQPLRSLAPLPPVSFELGGRRFDLRLTPTHLGATAAEVVATGKAELDPG